MGQPHKHAEILRAIADGKDVQWQSKLDQSWNDPSGEINPIIDSDVDWRIKPEPKPDVVYFGTFGRLGDLILDCCFSKKKDPTDKLKLIFDGETGQLKAAEVLK